MPGTESVLNEVAKERVRQEMLKVEGRFRHTLADRGMDDGEKLAAICEEVGEVGRALLGNRMLVQDGGDLRKELLIHVAALAVAWVESIPLLTSARMAEGEGQ